MSAYDYLAPFYDSLTRDVDYSAFADFYEKLFLKNGISGKTVLDLACGTGTLTCILAERGYEMIGTDSSSDMLTEAWAKAMETECQVQPMFLNQAMEELDLYGTVNAAVCSLDGINYALPENIAEIFHRVWLFLEPGGVFIFDINTPFKLKNLDGEVFVDETDDVLCLWRAEFSEEDNSCFYGIDIFSRTGDLWEREREEHVEYSYEPEELKKYLLDAGYEDICLYGELKMDEPQADENRIFVTARKPK